MLQGTARLSESGAQEVGDMCLLCIKDAVVGGSVVCP